MSDSYSKEILINASVSKVFDAISLDLEKWWGSQSQPIESTDTIFIVSWKIPWYEFRVIDYLKDQKMIWECIDANQIIEGLTGVKREWVGTRIHWEIEEITDFKTRLKFRHEGLVPDFICFDFCSKTWDHFLLDALRKYLEK